MNKTITIYELLGLVKDGKAPKKIKYYDRKYVYDEYEGEIGYVDKNIYPYKWFAKEIDCDLAKDLNDTVEIIEDNNKLENKKMFKLNKFVPSQEYIMTDNELYMLDIANKINELIDHINKIEEKLDE